MDRGNSLPSMLEHKVGAAPVPGSRLRTGGMILLLLSDLSLRAAGGDAQGAEQTASWGGQNQAGGKSCSSLDHVYTCLYLGQLWIRSEAVVSQVMGLVVRFLAPSVICVLGQGTEIPLVQGGFGSV